MAVQVDNVRVMEIILCLVEHLSGIWPALATVEPASIEMTDRNEFKEFIAAMEALRERGYSNFERMVIEGGVPRFESAAITTKGRASRDALRFFYAVAQFGTTRLHGQSYRGLGLRPIDSER